MKHMKQKTQVSLPLVERDEGQSISGRHADGQEDELVNDVNGKRSTLTNRDAGNVTGTSEQNA